jgi:hypothetical protein
MNWTKLIFFVFILAFASVKSFGQQYSVAVPNPDDMDSLSNKHKRFSPNIYFGTELYPQRNLYSAYFPIQKYGGPGRAKYNDLDDIGHLTDSTINSTHYEFSITAPLISWTKPEGTHQVNLFTSGSVDDFRMSWFQSRHNLYSGNIGLQYLYYQPKENLFMVHFTTGFANDQNYLNSQIGLRYSGLVLFNHLKNQKFQYFIGLAATYAYSETQWIPLVGARIKITHKDYLRISFPLSKYFEFYPVRFAYYHPFSHRTVLFGEWENQGNSYRIYSADENISSNSASVQLRQQGKSIGVGVRYLLKNNVRLQFELNSYYRNNQTISIYNIDAKIDDRALSTYHIQSGVLLQASIMWNFNRHKKTAAPRVDYLDIQNIEVEDLPDDFQ